jgi:hypothetical protein
MQKQHLTLAAFAAAVLFVVGLVAGAFIPGCVGLHSSPRIYNTATVLRQVQTLSQLVTIKYVMEKVEIVEDPPQNPIRQFFPDNTRVILVARGIVKAGIDFSHMQPGDVRISGNKIILRLPPAQITDAYLDDANTRVIEHNTGFLRSFNKDLEQTTRQNAIDDIRRAARSSGILKDAEEKAQAQLTNLGRQLGFEEVEFSAR